MGIVMCNGTRIFFFYQRIMLSPIADRLTTIEKKLGILPSYRGSPSVIYNITCRLDAIDRVLYGATNGAANGAPNGAPNLATARRAAERVEAAKAYLGGTKKPGISGMAGMPGMAQGDEERPQGAVEHGTLDLYDVETLHPNVNGLMVGALGTVQAQMTWVGSLFGDKLPPMFWKRIINDDTGEDTDDPSVKEFIYEIHGDDPLADFKSILASGHSAELLDLYNQEQWQRKFGDAWKIIKNIKKNEKIEVQPSVWYKSIEIQEYYNERVVFFKGTQPPFDMHIGASSIRIEASHVEYDHRSPELGLITNRKKREKIREAIKHAIRDEGLKDAWKEMKYYPVAWERKI